MNKNQKKEAIAQYISEYQKACEKIIDQGQDENLHPVELIYSVASTALMAATLQEQGYNSNEINDMLKEMSTKIKEEKRVPTDNKKLVKTTTNEQQAIDEFEKIEDDKKQTYH